MTVSTKPSMAGRPTTLHAILGTLPLQGTEICLLNLHQETWTTNMPKSVILPILNDNASVLIQLRCLTTMMRTILKGISRTLLTLALMRTVSTPRPLHGRPQALLQAVPLQARGRPRVPGEHSCQTSQRRPPLPLPLPLPHLSKLIPNPLLNLDELRPSR